MTTRATAWLAFVAFTLAIALTLTSCSQSVVVNAPRYALVYGVSTYMSFLPEGGVYPIYPYYTNLSYSDDDAKSMGDLMKSYNWTVYSRIKGSVVSSDPTKDRTPQWPTKAQMIGDIDTLSKTITGDSTVLIYFSGHGGVDINGTAFIAPYEGLTDTSSPTIDFSACIFPADLSAMLSVLPTKNVIVIFDTCNSGGFVSLGSSIDASPQDYSSMQSYSAFSTAMSHFGELLSTNATTSGAKEPIVFSAAGSDESSYDADQFSHGAFTYYLLQAAVNGDKNGDGIVTTTEAYDYTVQGLKTGWDTNPNNIAFLPHLSGGTRDLVLFGQ